MPASFFYFLELLWKKSDGYKRLFYLHCSCKKKKFKLGEKNSNKKNLKVIKNILPHKSGNPESLKH